MSDALKILLNLRSLRATARELTLEQLQDVLEKLQTIVTEREESEAEAIAVEKERLNKLEKYRAMLLDDGIDPEELMASMGGTKTKVKTKAKRAARPAKYKYMDIDGTEKTWTGQGRTPKAIRDLLEQGKTMDDFLL